MISRLALITISLMGFTSASQQSSHLSHSRTIQFHTHSIDTRHMTHVLHQTHEHIHEKQPFLIQLEQENIHHVKQQVEQHLGYSLTHYYPSNTWLTYTTPHTVRTLASSISGIAWIGAYEPSYKYHSSIISSEWDEITPESMNDPISQYFFNNSDSESIIVNQNEKPQYSINVHMQQEASEDADSATQSSLVTLAQDWMRVTKIAGKVEIHGHDMITIHLKHQASIRPLSEHIAQHARVHYIERSYPNTLNNKWAKSISVWNLPAPPATTATTALTGANEVVGIIDTGVDANSCFFFDPNTPVTVTKYNRTATPQVTPSQHRKIIQYVQFTTDAVDDNGHGTHIAGTIAGSSLATGFAPFNGMATDAKLAVFDAGSNNQFVVPRPLDQFLLPYASAVGAAIHVNAWGNTNPAYDSTAQEFDKYMWTHPEFLAVVAAGNNGNGGITSPATSKNAIVVGATVSSKESYLGIFCPPSATNVDGGIYPNAELCAQAQTITPNSVTPWSSRGPTLDGRIKPDVVATGMFVVSAKNKQQKGQSCTAAPNQVLKARAGTSMSTGVVAGDVALIRQYFRGGYYPSGTPVNAAIQPSAALLKAIVIDGAIPATQIPGAAVPGKPDHGFGRMVVSNGIPLWGATFNLLMKRDPTNPLGDAFFTAATATTTQTFTFCAAPITTANPSRLTVTLVWTDAPGTVNTKDVLVNNLDLQVVNGATTLLGNGGTVADTKNNVEQVIISTLATATTMAVKVIPTKINQFNMNGQQPYALIVTGNVLEGACGTTTPTTGTTTTQPTTPGTMTNEFFTWVTSDFTMCSAACIDPVLSPQGGTQTRTVTCQSSTKGAVADSFCVAQAATLGPKPVTQQACNQVSCGLIKYQWTIGTFTTCSLPCADNVNTMGGVQTRTVTCQSIAQDNPPTTSVPVDPKFCADHVMPDTMQFCNTAPCPAGTTTNNGNTQGLLFEWRVSDPTTCSVVCGGGVALRQVTCFIGEIAVDATFCANLPMPSSVIPCNTQACLPGQNPTNTTTSAPTTDPALASTGGTGNTTLGNPDGMNGGIPAPPPLTGNLPAPVQQTFQWQVFDYGPCSVGCADVNNPQGGVQTRVVKCRSSLNNFDDDARCAPVPKPPTSKSCNMDACPKADDFNLEWVTGVYGICDIDTQVQTRWVVCKTTNNQYVDFAQCQAHVGPIPPTTQPCTLGPDPLNAWQTTFATPVWTWQAQRFGDCSQWCNGPGTQTRGLHCLAPMGLVATTFDQCRNDPNAGPQPITSQSCGAGPCAATPQWYGGDFIGCSDPDPCLGTEQRHVFCIDTNGKKLQDTTLCTAPQIPFTRSPCGACVPKAKTILGLAPSAVIGIAAGVGVLALIGVAYLALQWRRRVRDQNNKVASRIALSKV